MSDGTAIDLTKWLAAIAAGFALAAAAFGADPQPTTAGKQTGLIPRALLFGNPDRAAPQLSPDGKFISYLAPRDGVMNVWVAPVERLSEARPVTRDTVRGVRQYFWAYTGRHLLYMQDAGGDENFHVYRVDLQTDETKDLTPGTKHRASVQEVSHRRPDEILIAVNDRDPRYFDIHRVNLQTGEKSLVQQNDGFAGFSTDEDYRVRFGQRPAPDGGLEWLKPDGQGGWQPFRKVPSADMLTTRAVGFDKTGDVLYMVDSRDRDTGAVFTEDLKSGERKLVAQNDRADAGGVLLHPTENTIQAVSFTRARTEWIFQDAAVAADYAELAKVADGDINVVGRTLDDKYWLVAFLLDDGPVRYYRYDRAAKKAMFLFTNRQALDGWKLAKMRPVDIKSRDGLDLVGYLTQPPDKPAQPGPMGLLVHGGPWARDQWGLNSLHQFLSNRGYAVLSVNFRGSTGFGKRFVNAGNREWAGKMHDDLIDATTWAVKEGVADPKKVAIMGGSYGGYSTLVGLTFTPDVFACGVDIVGPSNLVTLLKTIPPYWAPQMQVFKDRVGDVTTDEGQRFLAERSPLSRVENIARPLLIGQGANDPRVKQAESDQIVTAMHAKNIPVTYVLFPDEGHGFARPQNSLAFNAVVEAFLAKHLGGRFEAVGSAFEGSTVTVPSGVEGVPGVGEKLSGPKPQ